jgi:hypothetical protein
MKILKALLTLSLGILLILMGVSISFAITSESVVTKTATAQLTGAPSGGMTVSLEGGATALSWSGVTVGTTTWKVAEEYIQLDCDFSGTGWGIQIYTNNTATDANPQWTGTGDSKCGLLATDDPSKRLPFSWIISDDLVSGLDGSDAGTPESEVTGVGSWKWMKDSADTGTYAFSPGEYFVTVWNENGILWGQAASERSPAVDNTTYIYISANFTTATTPRTYQTSKLTLELYTP